MSTTLHWLAGLLIGSLFIAAPAEAATRTVCLQFKISDARTVCPESGDPGAKRVCNPGSYGELEGWRYELWDKDSSGSDEYIGTWRIGNTGRRCTTFEWEGSSYSKGEANPDLYVILKNRVQPVSGGVLTRGVKGDGTAYSHTSWRNGTSGDSNAYVAQDCASGTTCQIASGTSLLPTSSTTSNKSLMLMSLDSAQRALETFDGAINSTGNHILLYVDELADLPSACSTACAADRDAIYMPDSLAHEGDRSTHEMGHVLQMREFGQDYLRDVCGSGWSVTSTEYESCATTEGFASYVGSVSWYEPNNSSTVPYFYGYNIETATPYSSTCSSNAGLPLQVMKSFWDFDDYNDETGVTPASAYDDTARKSTTWLLNNWDLFPNGTADGKDYENSNDGVNMWDYVNNVGITNTATFLNHNCLAHQDH